MIKYDLRCTAAGHGFEAWFRSSLDYDEQTARSLVSCPECGSVLVEKAPMAPAVVSGAVERRERYVSFARRLRETSDDVGDRFAEEALRRHRGEADAGRAIRGRATEGEVRGLMEEGVSFGALPPLPEDAN